MILILGNSDDCLLYLKTLVRYEEEVPFTKSVTTYLGKLHGQDVCIAKTNYSSYSSEVVATSLIAKYNPYVVIYIGDSTAVSKELNVGDIFIPNKVMIGDVNQTKRSTDYKINEVPGYSIFRLNSFLTESFTDAVSSFGIIDIKKGTLVSSNTYITDRTELNFNPKDIEEVRKESVAIDCEVGGVSLACTFYDLPFIPITTISCLIDNEESLLERTKVCLKKSVDIGKIIISFIAKISTEEAEKDYDRKD